jgi:hypothetical protein
MAETVNQSNEGSVARISVLEERVRALAQLVDERDRLYMVKFQASETAVSAAITASDKQTAASFASSEKAIAKAEEAQREYNIRSNEFRGQLDDQAKRLMPREEAQINFKSQDQKLESIKENFNKEVASLRESRSELSGKDKNSHQDRLQGNWVIGIIVAIILAAVSLAVNLLKH